MTEVAQVKPARERIVDAAAAVMRARGLANTTTKAIAAEAGYSEAMLYKHFADKQELFLAVLKERLPMLTPELSRTGTGDFAHNLVALVEQLLDFFTQSVPIAASIFGSPELLIQHREGVARGGGGPDAPIGMLRAYLDAERAAGRIRADADTLAAARLLVGGAFHQGFLAAYAGLDVVPDARSTAETLVRATLPALT